MSTAKSIWTVKVIITAALKFDGQKVWLRLINEVTRPLLITAWLQLDLQVMLQSSPSAVHAHPPVKDQNPRPFLKAFTSNQTERGKKALFKERPINALGNLEQMHSSECIKDSSKCIGMQCTSCNQQKKCQAIVH